MSAELSVPASGPCDTSFELHENVNPQAYSPMDARKRPANMDSASESPTKRPSTSKTSLVVKKLSEKAQLPVRGSAAAAGYDLCSAEDVVIPAKGRGLCKTDLAIAVPMGTYGRVAPRSGLAVKKGIDVGAGVIDADYRGNVGVVLFNFGDEDFQIKVGDRIAQLILECIVTPPVVEAETLPSTERGAGGFGSTGV